MGAMTQAELEQREAELQEELDALAWSRLLEEECGAVQDDLALAGLL